MHVLKKKKIPVIYAKLTLHVSGRLTFLMSILARFECTILLVFPGLSINIPLCHHQTYFIEYTELERTHKKHLVSWNHSKFKPRVPRALVILSSCKISSHLLLEIKSFTLLLLLTTRKNYSIWKFKIESCCYCSVVTCSIKRIAKPPLTHHHLLITCGYITKVWDASQGIFGLVVLMRLTKCCK